jgi:hypothetical protein
MGTVSGAMFVERRTLFSRGCLFAIQDGNCMLHLREFSGERDLKYCMDRIPD